MSAGNGPEATVLNCSVFQRKPKPEYVLGFGVKKGAVLVTRYFAADARLLKYVHGLQQQRRAQAQGRGQLSDLRCAGEFIENGIQIVKRVSDLVD